MFPITSLRICYRACDNWIAHSDSRQGAALAYYALFSIAPLLLLATHLATVVFGPEAATEQMKRRLEATMGKTSAAAVEQMLESGMQSSGNSGWTPVASIALLAVGALGGFLHVRAAFCMIWNLEAPSRHTWLNVILDYLYALAMVLVITVMLIASVAASLAAPFVQVHLHAAAFWPWLEVAGSFLFLTLLFTATYRILSGNRLSWEYALYGAVIASIFFTLGKTAFSWYIVYSGTASAYGAASSLVVFLVWVYYSSQILFFGAELIQARRTLVEGIK